MSGWRCETGGTALSCPTNTLLANAGLFDRVFVEPGCNDSGLAIGAGLYVNHQILDRPLRPRGPGYWPSPYLGPRILAGAVDAAIAAAGDDIVEVEVDDAAEDAAAALARNEIIGWFGRNGRYPGQFIWLHSVDVDSQGNVYTTEVSTGRRVQRFVMTGMSE